MSNVYSLPAPPLIDNAVRQVVTLDCREDGSLMANEHPSAVLHIAVSCLLQPQPGDSVCALVNGDQWWITDVLSCRDKNRPLVLRSAHSALSIEANDLSIQANQRLTLTSPSLNFIAQTSRWLAEKMEQIAGHLQTRCRSAERLVKESDRVEAEHIQHQASASYRVDSELTAVNGRTVLKIDGGQVHVG
jgi:hypothetical protein